MDVDAEIDRLYGVPLDEFVAERNALAKRLTKDGDRESSTEVKALRKPTVGAWALNQALRRRRTEAEALLATGERLREAHEQLLGGGDAGELREAMREERALTSVIADCAEAIASEGGKSGPALRERVRATLHAASVDEEARLELMEGRFLREREAVGLGAFGTSEAPAEAPKGTRRSAEEESGERSTARRRREAAGKSGRTREQRTAEERRTGRGRAAGRARQRGADAAPTREERAAEVARAREQRAAEAARADEERLAEAERTLAEAQAELETAEAQHADALAALESARGALQEAEDAEREARRAMRARSREVAKQERAVERMRPKS